MYEEIIIFISAAIIASVSFLIDRSVRNKHQRDFDAYGIISTPNGKGKKLSLTTINGCEMGLIGNFRFGKIDNVQTYIAYYSLHIFFVPIFLFSAYRVIKTQNGYIILGSEPASLTEIGLIYLKAVAWIASIIAFIFLLMIILN